MTPVKPVSVSLQKQRDKKEVNLSTIEQMIKTQNSTIVRSKLNFEKEVLKYQKWKEEYGVQGIKY
jgi:ribosomal protein L18E